MSIKISELNVANTPLIGNEVVPIVQDGETKKVSVSSIINTYFDNGNSSINTEIDWSKATVQEINLDDDPTLTFSNESIGQRLSLLLRQGLPGQRTIIWPNGVKWNGDILPILPSVGGAGSFDNTFNIGGGFNSSGGGRVISLAIQSDGKILVGGKFTDFNGNSVNYICRLNPNGTIDNTFNIGTGFNSVVNSLSVQSDSKILVGGNFSDYDGNSVNYICRLNPNGTIDNTFNIGGGFNSPVNSLSVQSDSKILVGGNFSDYDGNSVNYICRLNPNGTIDNTFNIGGGFNSPVISLAIQSDGKILVGGKFTDFNGNTSNWICRLNPNGTIDNTFNIGGGFNSPVNSLSVQSDSKILVGGNFSDYDGNTSNYICRLNPNGTIDNTFNIGTGFDDTVISLAIQSDGKILVGGGFSSYDGNSGNKIVRLNSDGTIDNTFNIGTGFNNVVISLAIQSDGKILVGGKFTDFNGNSVNYITRLIAEPTPVYSTINFVYNGTNYIGYF